MEKSKLINFTASTDELKIIDEIRRKNYTMNQSQIIRLLIHEGAKSLLGDKYSKVVTAK